MWLFYILLRESHQVHFAIKDDKQATELFRDLQSWINEKTDITTPKGICVKTATNDFAMFKTSEVVGAEVKKTNIKDYELRYGKLPD